MTKYLILNGDSDFNLGDAAILEATCRALATADPGAEITVTSALGSASRLPGVVEVIPRGPRGLPRLLASARRQHRVIVAGGGLFQDDDSWAKMPYWAVRLVLLRLLRNNLVGHSIGAGPLNRWGSPQFAYLACSTLRSLSVRDDIARECLQRCTRFPVGVTPDPAFLLAERSREEGAQVIRSAGLSPDLPLIAVALRGWFHKRGGLVPRHIWAKLGRQDDSGYDRMQRLLDALAPVIRRIAAKLGAGVLFLPSYRVPHEGDVTVCRDLATRLRSETRVGMAVLDSPSLYKSVLGHCKLIVSARMHPLIFAAGMGVPGVGLAYNDKFAGLYAQLGIEKRLIALDKATDPDVVNGLEALAFDALQDPVDLRQRSAHLAQRVSASIADLVQTSDLVVAQSSP
jgi:L-malate glycosyltransferase